MLEEVIEKAWPPVDLWARAGQLEAPSLTPTRTLTPTPHLFLEYKCCPQIPQQERIQGHRLERGRYCWGHCDSICDWIQLRHLCKFLLSVVWNGHLLIFPLKIRLVSSLVVKIKPLPTTLEWPALSLASLCPLYVCVLGSAGAGGGAISDFNGELPHWNPKLLLPHHNTGFKATPDFSLILFENFWRWVLHWKMITFESWCNIQEVIFNMTVPWTDLGVNFLYWAHCFFSTFLKIITYC